MPLSEDRLYVCALTLASTLPLVCADCAGTMAAYLGCAILPSYLVLFIAFYIDVYKRKGSRRSKRVSYRAALGAQVDEYVYVAGKHDFAPNPTTLRSRKKSRDYIFISCTCARVSAAPLTLMAMLLATGANPH